MMDYLGCIAILVAIGGSIIACYTDIKTKEIPNSLTLSMIFIGLLLFSLSFHKEWIFFIPLISSYILIWLIWRAGMWGGGDAKLIMGLLALLSPYYGIEFIPVFFVMIALSSFLHYFIFGLIETIREKKGKNFVMMMSMVTFLPLLSYFLLKSISKSIAIVAALAILFITGDIVSSFLPSKKRVKISEKVVGEIMAETIYVKNGRILRVEKEPSLIMRVIKRNKIRGRGIDILLKPKYTGISREEIGILKKCCDDILIFISYPMAPVILAALILTLVFGKEIFHLINF